MCDELQCTLLQQRCGSQVLQTGCIVWPCASAWSVCHVNSTLYINEHTPFLLGTEHKRVEGA